MFFSLKNPSFVTNDEFLRSRVKLQHIEGLHPAGLLIITEMLVIVLVRM